MSISLNVVSIAAVRCASTRRRAIVWRRLLMRTRSSRRSPGARRGAVGAAGVAGREGAGADGVLAPIAPTTSCFMTRPAAPVPCTAPRFTSCSFAMRFAVGVARAGSTFRVPGSEVRVPSSGFLVAASATFAVSAGALFSFVSGAAAGFCAAAASSTTASSSPTLTSSPSCRLMLASTPPCSAPTSRSIFSVSSSTTGSPTSTRSPSFFSHRATRASTTDSPSCGTTILDISVISAIYDQRPTIYAPAHTSLDSTSGASTSACRVNACSMSAF